MMTRKEAEAAQREVSMHVSNKGRGLVAAMSSSTFDLGELFGDDEADYEMAFTLSIQDETAVLEYIAELEKKAIRR